MEPQAGDPWSVGVLRRTYESADAAIGRLVSAMPAATTVILVSDHGFRPWGHEDGPEAFFVAAGPSVRPTKGPAPRELTRAHLRRLGSILDVTPTLLALCGVPVGLDMDGRILARAFAPLPGTTAPAAVASHDTAEWLAARGEAKAPAPGGEDDEERIEQLKALGYIN
jgi:arylsulfatase A-like enzyme